MKVVYRKTTKPKGVSLWLYFFLLMTATIVLSFTSNAPKPPAPMKMKAEFYGADWVRHDKWINISKTALAKSDLPAKDVTMILDSLTYFQQELYRQLNPQFKIEDSLNRIKPKN